MRRQAYQRFAREFFAAEKERKRLRESDVTRNKCLRHLRGAIEEGAYRPEEFSLRALFEHFVADGRELVETFRPGYGDGVSLMEAGDTVNTAAFANITGQIVYSKVLEAFNDPGFLHPEVATTIPTQFNGEKIPGIGRLGDNAESIGEAAEYPLVGTAEEWIETPATDKKGFIVPVTKEAIFFDRTGLVLQRAGEVAYWLGQNKEKRILDVVFGITNNYKRNGTAENTYQDGSPSFDNTQASNALADWTDIETAELLFDGLTDPNTGEPIAVVPNTIIVPTALKHTARRIINATEVRHGSDPVTLSGNVLDNYSLLTGPMVKARTSSATTWFIGDPKRAFAYMENWPVTVVQAPANSEAEFTRDIVSRFKVSERGAAAVMEPRYMVKCTA